MIDDYISFVIIGKSEVNKVWRWNVWSEVILWLNPIIAAARDKVAVRSVQGADSSRKNVRFGRLGWDERSHHKWTHASKFTEGESAEWMFCCTEVWVPSYTICQRERRSPTVFIKIENPFVISVDN